jgi:2',3'-cyclic-nucleotide 2'-phosphodiesterase/3'-nucleotidase
MKAMKRVQMACMIAILGAIGINACKENIMEEKKIHISIYETTDVHGAIFPDDLINQRRRSGSLAQVHHYISKMRNAKEQEVILVDNGDLLQGDPSVYYYNFESHEGKHLLAEVMNFMQYDVACIGNHDIEAGHEVYDSFRKGIQFDWLGANAIRVKDSTPYFSPYKIIEKKGVKIAFIGLTTPSIPRWLPEHLWEGIYFEDMVKSAKKWIKIVQQNEKPDVIVGLFHSGLDEHHSYAKSEHIHQENASRLIAETVPGFDVIFAGHDHRIACEHIQNCDGDSLWLMNAGPYAAHLAAAQLYVRKTGNQTDVTIKGEIIDMEHVPADSMFLYQFNVKHERVRKYVRQAVGKSTHEIDASKALFGSSAFVDIIHQVQLDLTQADLSLASPFTLYGIISKGNLSMRDLFKLYRFENYLTWVEMSGAEFKNILEYSYNLWVNTMENPEDRMINIRLDKHGNPIRDRKGRVLLAHPYYNFDSGGGLVYDVDLRKPYGQRVIIKCMQSGEKFDSTKIYKVAMNSYRANGGGDLLPSGAGIPHQELKSRLKWSSEEDFRLLLKSWIQKQDSISPKAMKHWQFIPKEYAEKGVLTYIKGL